MTRGSMKELAASLLLLMFSSPCMMANTTDECPLVMILPFSRSIDLKPNYNKYTPSVRAYEGYSVMAAAHLAIKHFNNRDTTVVSELEQFKDCDVRFPSSTVSSFGDLGEGSEGVTSFNYVIDSTMKPQAATSHYFAYTQRQGENYPCAIIGPSDPRVAEATAGFSTAMKVPQVIYGTTEDRASDPELYPTAIRNFIPLSKQTSIIVSYLWSRQYFAILADEMEFGHLMTSSLFRDARVKELPHEELEDDDFGQDELFAVSVPFDCCKGDENRLRSLATAMASIQQSGIKTIFVASASTSSVGDMAMKAEEYDLLGDDMFWVFVDDMLPPSFFSKDGANEVSGAVSRLLNGSAIFRMLDGFELNPEEHLFHQSWNSEVSADAEFLRRMDNATPRREDGTPYYSSEMALSPLPPSPHSSFVYDSVIATGIGACKFREKQRQQLDKAESVSIFHGAASDETTTADSGSVNGTLSSLPAGEREEVPSPNLVDEILSVRFHGASSTPSGVIFGEYENSRATESMFCGIVNIRMKHDEETGAERPDLILTQVSDNGGENWTIMNDFTYRDGSTVPPTILRDVTDENFLEPEVRAIGLGLMVTALVLNISTLLWLFLARKHSALKASQPIFLAMLCFGSALMSLAILPLANDESYGWSKDALSIGCMSAMWVLTVGYIVVYLTLFSKLWRVDRILQFGRRAVTINQVIGPFAGCLIAAITLLTIWTAQDPLTWERDTVEFSRAEWETYGQCDCENVSIFLFPLIALMVTATGLCAFMAYRTMDCPGNLVEGKPIVNAIVTQIQVWALGVPLQFILVEVSSDAIFLGRVAMISTFSISMTCFVVGPRFWDFLEDKLCTRGGKRKRGRGARGGIGNGGVRVSGINTLSQRFNPFNKSNRPKSEPPSPDKFSLQRNVPGESEATAEMSRFSVMSNSVTEP